MPDWRQRRRAPRSLASLGPGNDDWQRQADAAAWAAVSGMHPSLYLGAIEPIPVPPELRRRLRDAGRAFAALPSAERLDRLMRLAHEAAYGSPLETAQPAASPASDEWWADLPPHREAGTCAK
jgi:hypothetical protein